MAKNINKDKEYKRQKTWERKNINKLIPDTKESLFEQWERQYGGIKNRQLQ